MRVSTGRQAAHEPSLDEQDRKIRACAELKDGDVVAMVVEQGASGRTDKRPVFQQMVAFALDRANAVDVVYDFSRYFRNVTAYLQYRTLLKDAGVRLISATQDVPEGATGELIETIFAAFDGHASDVNAATVRDMMMANAEAGYWNGARQPYGYRTHTVAVPRKKEKKRLVIVEDEARIVRLVYKLCLEGDVATGPLGVKAICTVLNARGYTLRGRPFYTAAVETSLKSETYAGTAYFNMFAAIADAPDLIRLDDPLARGQIALLNRQRAELSAPIRALRERPRTGPVAITDQQVAAFSTEVRRRPRHADPAFRRQWLHLFVDEVIVGRSEITISGRSDTLPKGVTGKADFFGPAVPSSDQEWRTRHDSNV